MPPLTIENSSALVSGGVPSKEKDMKAEVQAPKPPATLEVEVLRSFMNVDCKPTKVGDRLTLPRVFALEMKAANKVRLIEADEPAPETAQPEKQAEKPKADGYGSKKGGRDAA